jgi:LmbE family N-acetylglucosaminyl deacetylase
MTALRIRTGKRGDSGGKPAIAAARTSCGDRRIVDYIDETPMIERGNDRLLHTARPQKDRRGQPRHSGLRNRPDAETTRVKVLILAPHPDDETLGCGGTIARLVDEGHEVVVGLITGQGNEPHPLYGEEEMNGIQEEFSEACAVLGVSSIRMLNLPPVLISDIPKHVLNKTILNLVEDIRPEIMFVPFPLDLHGDHREIFHAASIAWRPYLQLGGMIREVYCYEVPSETHLNIPYVEQGFTPNLYYDISNQIERKLKAFSCFASQVQASPLPRSIEAVRALANFRGSQIGVQAAEAFVSVRVLR